MHKHGIQLKSDQFWVPTSQYENNVAIMDAIRAKQEEYRGTSSCLSNQMVNNANTVRIYLKCTFASELGNSNTDMIHRHLYEARCPRQTETVYAYQPRPSEVAITDWKRCVQLAFIRGARHLAIAFRENTEVPQSRTPASFNDHYMAQPEPLWDIVGKAFKDIPENITTRFAKAIADAEDISIFGDGSVKDSRGAHATRVYADGLFAEGTEYIEAANVTSGDPAMITSLRSETASALSGLYILQMLTDYYSFQITAKVHFYYDNCKCLRRLDTLREFKYFADPMATDYDVWAEMKRILAHQMDITIEVHHVKAHQDLHEPYADLPRDAQVNCDMDKAAETM